MISQYLSFFILVPLIGFLFSAMVPVKRERLMSVVAISTVAIQLLGAVVYSSWWIWNGGTGQSFIHFVLYSSPKFEFRIEYFFDWTTMVFALVGAILTFIVVMFSKFYMHRDSGFKRFFNKLLLFYTGYNLLVFSGNLETLFVGWEILGVTSFLLIAFYRDRYLPVRNGFKVLSFYRLGDVCLILAMWMSHHLWHKNVSFPEWNDSTVITTLFSEHYALSIFIATMFLLAAVIKSAQLPFSSWLPRAMEGPTTSSAIFYGSLAVHIGVLLLLRTYPFWEQENVIRGIIIFIGVATSLVATGIARVQSTVKTQIAYASIAQIGIMFVEIALGFHALVLVHFAGNAFLRTYQLLVSPSVLNYKIHDMFFNFVPRVFTTDESTMGKMRKAIYVLNVKEWNIDSMLRKYLWVPFKNIGRLFSSIGNVPGIIMVAVILGASLVFLLVEDNFLTGASSYVSPVMAALSFLLVLKGFVVRGDGAKAWTLVFVSQLFNAMAILWNVEIEHHQLVLYLGGSLIAAVTGYFVLRYIRNKEGDISLGMYHGHSYEHPLAALIFLLACLAMSGFPITPSFIGTDIMFTHIRADQLLLIGFMGLSYLFAELTLIRIYVRVFLGQHRKEYHPIAFKSS